MMRTARFSGHLGMWGWGVGGSARRVRVGEGGGLPGACLPDTPQAPPCGQTNACENITLHQLCLRAVIKKQEGFQLKGNRPLANRSVWKHGTCAYPGRPLPLVDRQMPVKALPFPINIWQKRYILCKMNCLFIDTVAEIVSESKKLQFELA